MRYPEVCAIFRYRIKEADLWCYDSKLKREVLRRINIIYIYKNIFAPKSTKKWLELFSANIFEMQIISMYERLDRFSIYLWQFVEFLHDTTKNSAKRNDKFVHSKLIMFLLN